MCSNVSIEGLGNEINICVIYESRRLLQTVILPIGVIFLLLQLCIICFI